MGLMLIACTDPTITKIRSQVEPEIKAKLIIPQSYEFVSLSIIDTTTNSATINAQMIELEKYIEQYPDDPSYKKAKQFVQNTPISNYQIIEVTYKAKDTNGELKSFTYNAEVMID